MKPFGLLYHGTCYCYSRCIEKNGIRPVNHKQVYLTADLQVAYDYAKQNSKENGLSFPVICIVDALQMHKDGYTFTHETSNAEWTTDYVPSKYVIQIMVESEDELDLVAHYAQKVVEENEEYGQSF